jgi:hypothetical protein
MNRKNAPVKGKYSCIKVDEFLHIPHQYSVNKYSYSCNESAVSFVPQRKSGQKDETSSAVISGQDAHAQNRR